MVAAYRQVIERKEELIAVACNHPNWLVIPFSLELVRAAAQLTHSERVAALSGTE
jgi:hypothetical protein